MVMKPSGAGRAATPLPFALPANADAHGVARPTNAPRPQEREKVAESRVRARPSSLLATRAVYCGDNLEQFAKLSDGPCLPGHDR
jgi:hypothetical protein